MYVGPIGGLLVGNDVLKCRPIDIKINCDFMYLNRVTTTQVLIYWGLLFHPFFISVTRYKCPIHFCPSSSP